MSDESEIKVPIISPEQSMELHNISIIVGELRGTVAAIQTSVDKHAMASERSREKLSKDVGQLKLKVDEIEDSLTAMQQSKDDRARFEKQWRDILAWALGIISTAALTWIAIHEAFGVL